MIKRGHNVTIFASNYSHFAHTFINTNAQELNVADQAEVPFVLIPTGAYQGNTLKRFLNMLNFSFRLLQKKHTKHITPPDIIIGSSPHLFAAFSAFLLARRFNVPFLLEVRDIWPDSLAELSHLSKRHPLYYIMKKIEFKLYHGAHRIISVLPEMKNYLQKSGIAEEKIEWLPNTMDPDLYHASTHDNEKSKKFTVFYAGAHGIANDLDTCLDAAKLLQQSRIKDQVEICLIGQGPQKNHLMERVKAENINNVTFLEPVPKAEIYSILNRADVFLMPLKHSPIYQFGISPNKLFDYLFMAKPIIFAVETPFNPVQSEHAGISIPPENPQALADAIDQLFFLSSDEREAMGKRGKNYVVNHYHIDTLGEKLERILVQAKAEAHKVSQP